MKKEKIQYTKTTQLLLNGCSIHYGTFHSKLKSSLMSVLMMKVSVDLFGIDD